MKAKIWSITFLILTVIAALDGTISFFERIGFAIKITPMTIQLIQDIARLLLPFFGAALIWQVFRLFERQNKKNEIQMKLIDAIYSYLHLSKSMKDNYPEKYLDQIKQEILDSAPENERKLYKEILGI